MQEILTYTDQALAAPAAVRGDTTSGDSTSGDPVLDAPISRERAPSGGAPDGEASNDNAPLSWRDVLHKSRSYQTIRFGIIHMLPLGAIWSGVRMVDVWVCIALYFGRMFFITAGFHRYFAHRSYRTNRFVQFLMAFGGGTAAQKGALWWAAHHRAHHKYSDTEKDVHSPQKGFFWSHMGWVLVPDYSETDWDRIKDLSKYPELRWLNKFHLVPPVALGLTCYLVGGWSMLFIGFFLSTVLLYHGTFTINSLSHVWGKRRFVTNDTSRNSFILALITNGEGWHNNHHYYQAAARQGFYWWEIDLSYYVLRVMSWFRLVRDLRQPPQKILSSNRIKDGCSDIGMFQAYWKKASRSLHNARSLKAHKDPATGRALEEFLDNTRQTAERFARLSTPSEAPGKR